MQQGPSGLVRADLQRPLQAQRRDPVLACGEVPAGGEPDREGRPGPIEDCARRDRGPAPAFGTHVPPVSQTPSPRMATSWTEEAGGPPQPFQVIQAVGIRLEPSLELTQGPGVVRTSARGFHRASLRGTPVKWIAQILVYPPQRLYWLAWLHPMS